MAITRIINPTCRAIDPSTGQSCGRPLTDRISKMFMIGSDCRGRMTDAQLREALAQAKREADPGYIPPDRAATPSPRARHTNAVARATITQAATPETATCHHGALPGRCGDCRREADPTRAAERVLAEVRSQSLADRRAERVAAQDGRYPARTPSRPLSRSPAPAPADPAQMEMA